MDKLFCRKVIFREIILQVDGGKYRPEFLQVGVDLASRQVEDPVWQGVESLFFNAWTNHREEQREVGYSPAGDKVEFPVHRFKACIHRDDIFQPESFSYSLHDLDLLPDGVDQGKLNFGEHHRQRDPGKPSPGTGIHNGGTRFEVGEFCNGKRMEDMMNAGMIDIFPGDHVDAGIPFAVEALHFHEAFSLAGG